MQEINCWTPSRLMKKFESKNALALEPLIRYRLLNRHVRNSERVNNTPVSTLALQSAVHDITRGSFGLA